MAVGSTLPPVQAERLPMKPTATTRPPPIGLRGITLCQCTLVENVRRIYSRLNPDLFPPEPSHEIFRITRRTLTNVPQTREQTTKPEREKRRLIFRNRRPDSRLKPRLGLPPKPLKIYPHAFTVCDY